METLPAETVPHSKLRRFRSWIGCFTLFAGVSVLFYYGYCWGLWGRGSLLLQYLFQCNCPASSEQARYPKQVEVIVPACSNSGVRLSPSGRFLYVWKKKWDFASTYLLDLQTREKIPFALPEGDVYFLTDDWLYVFVWGKGEIIFDRTTGKQYPIQRFTTLHPEAWEQSSASLSLLAEELHKAKYMFLINDNDIVVALAPDFSTSPEKNFLTGWFDIPGLDRDRVKRFLQENHIAYQNVPPNFPDEAVSPDGRFVARLDGIYLAENNQKIVDGYSAGVHRGLPNYFSVRGWVYDSSGAVYTQYTNSCLIETNFLLFDESFCFFETSQPELILKVPEEYLLPKETP